MSDETADIETAVMTDLLPERDGQRRWAAAAEWSPLFVSGFESEVAALQRLAGVLALSQWAHARENAAIKEVLELALERLPNGDRAGLRAKLDAVLADAAKPPAAAEALAQRDSFLAAWQQSAAELLVDPAN